MIQSRAKEFQIAVAKFERDFHAHIIMPVKSDDEGYRSR
jgi:hypothetical protein